MDTETNTELAAIDHPGVGESGPTITFPAMPVERLRLAPWNPRKHFDEAALTELSADITARGILQALVVRDVGPHLEIVCGHRRYLAARRAGLAVVPVIVRVLDDRAALECALSENGQREGLHPLEEADGFGVLHTKHGVSVEDIAARHGVSTKLVYQRLSLSKLCDEGREAFLAGKINWGVALRIARVENLDWQREAVKFALSQTWFGTDVSGVSRWIANRYAVRLASAPFDVTDAMLVPSAGACGACPKNSDAQRALFGDDVSAGECLDVVCFASKKEAAWKLTAAQYAAQGITVMSAEQSATVMPMYEGSPLGGGYVRADEKPYDHAQGRKTWRELLGVHAPPVVVARGADGNAVEVFEPAAFKAAKKAAGLGVTKVEGKGKSSSSGSSKGSTSKSTTDYRAEIEADEKISAATATALSDALAKRTLTDGDRALWQMLATVVLSVVDPGSANAVIAKRNKGKMPVAVKGDYYAQHKEEIAVLSASGCRMLIFELLIEEARGGVLGEANDLLRDAVCGFLRVDVKAVEKKVRDEIEAAKKTSKPAAKKPAAKPAKKGRAK